jgi:5-methylcytosine-specific restriction protein A
MTTGHPFSTRKGRRLREAKLRSVDWLCEICRREGRLAEAKQVHHVQALEDGGEPFPPLNGLEALCDDHHLGTHGGKPKGGVDPTSGLPLPGSGHWWCNDE